MHQAIRNIAFIALGLVLTVSSAFADPTVGDYDVTKYDNAFNVNIKEDGGAGNVFTGNKFAWHVRGDGSVNFLSILSTDAVDNTWGANVTPGYKGGSRPWDKVTHSDKSEYTITYKVGGMIKTKTFTFDIIDGQRKDGSGGDRDEPPYYVGVDAKDGSGPASVTGTSTTYDLWIAYGMSGGDFESSFADKNSSSPDLNIAANAAKWNPLNFVGYEGTIHSSFFEGGMILDVQWNSVHISPPMGPSTKNKHLIEDPTPTTGVPEPASMLLLAVAGAAVWRRRRK